MTRFRTLALALTTLAVSYNPAVAEQKGEEKSPSARVDRKQAEAAPSKSVTGKVTGVDEKAKTFTVAAKDRSLTFDATELKALPRVGDVIDVTYSENSSRTKNGPKHPTAKSINLNSSRSNIY